MTDKAERLEVWSKAVKDIEASQRTILNAYSEKNNA